ncbi:hypothetical protein V8E55_007201 [Tylopilus felleus]
MTRLMGRPKLCATPEERVLAAHAYQVKYYERNWDVINKKVTEKRKKNDVLTGVTHRELGAPCNLTSSFGIICQKTRCYCVALGSRGPEMTNGLVRQSMTSIEVMLNEIIGRSSHERLATLYQRYIAFGNFQKISDTLASVEVLNQHIWSLTLYVSGWLESGTNIPGGSISQAICNVIRVLEDLLLNAIEGNDLKSEISYNWTEFRTTITLSQCRSDLLLMETIACPAFPRMSM